MVVNANKIQNKDKDWFKLDNAAKIYPASASKKWNAVFRIAAIINAPVERAELQTALNDVMVRFPTFQCTLKRGAFWHYMQKLDHFPTVQYDTKYPCQQMPLYKNRHLMRVLIYNNRISLEVFHSLCDGTGALIFLNTLLARYFELTGHSIADKTNSLNLSQAPTEGELEDSFLRYSNQEKIAMRSSRKAYRIKGTNEKRGVTNVTSLVMSEKELKNIALNYDCSITHLLAAVLILSINEEQQHKKHKVPVVAELAINLRKIFPSQSVRNFSYFTQVTFNANKTEAHLQTVINIVKARLAESTDKKWLIANINANVKDEKNIALRLVPRFLKDFGMSIAAFLYSDRAESVAFSAMGRINAPTEFANLVNRYESLIVPPKRNKYACCSICYNDNYVFSFTSKIKETNLEHIMVSKLKELGAYIAYETNRA